MLAATKLAVTAAEVYTNCNGTDSGGTATTGPCVPDRQGTMYIAYFDSPVEASVTVDSETQIAPIRMGEITVVEYEVAAHVNASPIAVDDDLSADQGSTTNLNLAVNDSDAEDELNLASITIVTAPAHAIGPVVVKSDGTVNYTHDGTTARSDTFTYTIKDNSGAESNTATVTLAIFGNFTNGQAKYDAACASCHAAGSYDTSSTKQAGDLYDLGEFLVTDLSSLGGMNNLSITPQELLDLTAFLEDPSIAPQP